MSHNQSVKTANDIAGCAARIVVESFTGCHGSIFHALGTCVVATAVLKEMAKRAGIEDAMVAEVINDHPDAITKMANHILDSGMVSYELAPMKEPQ